MSVERRRHARIAVDIPCRLSGEVGLTRLGRILDVSLVGAKVVGAAEVAGELEPVVLGVDEEGYPELEVRARVMYHRTREEGLVSGLQFVEMDAATHRAVTAFVEAALAGSGGGQRAHPRVTHRVDVHETRSSRARAVIQDISRGGVRLTLPDRAEVGDPIAVSVRIGKLDVPLELSGEIVRVGRDGDGAWEAAVRLDAPEGRDRALLERLLAILVKG